MPGKNPEKSARSRRDRTKSLLPDGSTRQQQRMGRLFRVVRVLFLLGLLCGFLGVAAIAGIFLYYTRGEQLPTIDRINEYQPKVVTRVLASDGTLIGEIFEERRTVVRPERIPKLVKDAFLAAEDAHFFEHPGINVWGLFRALAQSVIYRRPLRGASTITQQLVKTYVLKSDERTLRRKVQEMYLALRLEKVLTKDEILWLYLNQISFGHGRFGIEEAARYYFGKSITDVSIGEAAVLASLPKAPEEFGGSLRSKDEKRNNRIRDRQHYVLSQLERYHFITKEEALRVAAAPIEPISEPPSLQSLAPEFVEEVEHMLTERFGQARLPYLGLNVRTTCDARIQKAARTALESGLLHIDERQGYRQRIKHLSSTEQTKLHQALLRELPTGPPVGKLVEGVVTQLIDGEAGQASGWAVIDLGGQSGMLPLFLDPQKDRYNPKGLLPSKRFEVGDLVRVRVRSLRKEGPILALEQGPQGAVMVIDPETRHVLAMVGGYGYLRGGFNRARRAKRQPGSAFKTFLVATALDSRRYTAATILNDSPQVYDLPDLKAWMPKNASDHRQYMGEVRLRSALAFSLNTVASQLMYDLKPPLVAAMASKLGIVSPLDQTYALALGSSVVTLEELTNAYATLAASGRHAESLRIVQVGDEKPAETEAGQAITPELAYVVTSLLQSVIEEGTAASIKGKLKRVAAGKTGTTNDNRDAWFVGYTPNVVAGVWVGFDDNRPLGDREQGARTALPIWLEAMQAAVRERPVTSFVQPAGVSIHRIDPKTGKLAVPGAPALDEVFLLGTEPQEQGPATGDTDSNTFNMKDE